MKRLGYVYVLQDADTVTRIYVRGTVRDLPLRARCEPPHEILCVCGVGVENTKTR